MKRGGKRFFQRGFGVLVSTAVILVGWSMLSEATITVADTQETTGRITNRNIGKFFTFTVSGSPHDFTVYQPGQDYALLAAELGVGDSILVRFINSQTANTQVYQVVKNGKTVLDKDLLTGQNRTGGVLALLGGLVMMGVAVWQFRRGK